MKKGSSEISEDIGLRFFGKVTASVSHEIKNVLAIINENAGLLGDLARMAEKGRPLDIERVRILAGKVRDQVLRGDGIIKNMNRFAHSIDRVIEQVDLSEILALVAELAKRLAFMKGVTLKVKTSSERIMVTTNPFLLENLLWVCLNLVMESEPYPETIGLEYGSVENGAQIRFTGLRGSPQSMDDLFFKQIRDNFIDTLEGDLNVNQGAGEIVIDLPRNISGG